LKEVNNLQVQNVQNWFHPETNSNYFSELDPSFTGNFEHILEENILFSGFQEGNFQHDPNPIIPEANIDELGSVVFSNYHQH